MLAAAAADTADSRRAEVGLGFVGWPLRHWASAAAFASSSTDAAVAALAAAVVAALR